MADGIAAFQEAVRLDPDNAAHHVDLGRALNADERDEAVKAFREAVLLEPDNATYHADLGRALNALGRFDQADAAFEKAVRLDPDNAIHQKERIVNYVISLADWRSDKHDLEHRGVQWDDYIYNVRCITITQLPNIRIPYQNWSQTEDAQLATRRAIAPKIRRRRWVFFSLILISAVAGVIITSFLSRLIGSLLLGMSAVLAIIEQILSRRQYSQVDKDVYVLSDQLITLVSNLVLEPAITAALQIVWRDPDLDQVRVLDGPELSAKAGTNNLVTTEAHRRLTIALSRRNGAAVGVAGPRGSGKTELARAFTDLRPSEPSSRTIGLMLWAPVKYDAQTFLLRLLKELCIDVISTGSPRSRGYSSILVTGSRRRLITINIVASGLIVLGMALVAVKATATNIRPAVPFIVGGALIIIGGVAVYATRKQRSPRRRRDVGITQEIIDRAAELRTRVEFTETYTRNSQLGISGRGLSMSATEGAQLARIPLNEIDVVRELINLIKGINGWQVVIAIDELDKMQSDTEAIEFLNHVKVLFPIQGCSFIVSVSENAWARFENRGIPFSDAFDSSFDEIVHVQMLRPHESRDLLKRRNPNISDSQALLCHCLSGGLPRDLLRATRLLARVATQLRKDGETEPPRLSKVLDVLLVEDLSEKIEAFKVQTRNTENRTESNLDAITIWPQVWPDLKETEHWLGCVRANHDNNRVASLSERSPQYAEFQAYIAVLHTIRQAFSSKGPLTELEKESNFDNDLIGLGFDRIARARRCLATDVDSTWRLLDGARETLKLELIRAVSDE